MNIRSFNYFNLESQIGKIIISTFPTNSVANSMCNSFTEYRTDEMVTIADPHDEGESIRN
jgi:hypothetical protein